MKLLIPLAATAALLGCDRRDPTPAPTAAPTPAPAAPAPTATPPPAPSAPAMAGDWASPLGDASLYDLEVTVRAADGRDLPLASLAGGPVIVTMFYATCPAACPRLIDDLKGIERALTPAQRAAIRFVLVSFDPARDTPATLTALAGERALGPQWVLASATDDVARELAAALGIKYRVLDDGEFFHTSVITALDATGRPLARIEGLGREADTLLAALR